MAEQQAHQYEIPSDPLAAAALIPHQSQAGKPQAAKTAKARRSLGYRKQITRNKYHLRVNLGKDSLGRAAHHSL